MTAIASGSLYVTAPDVPAGMTLAEYRRRRLRVRRRGVRRLADASGQAFLTRPASRAQATVRRRVSRGSR